MKISSLNNSCIDFNFLKIKFIFSKKIFLITILAIFIIEVILLTLFFLGIVSPVVFVSLCIFFSLLTVISAALLLSYFIEKKSFITKESPEIRNIANQTKFLEEKKETLRKLLNEHKKNIFLKEILTEISLEDATKIQIKVIPSILDVKIIDIEKKALEQWVEDKVKSLAYVDFFCPPGDGDCLFSAFIYFMRCCGLEVNDSLQLREFSVDFLRDCLLKDNVSLIFFLNDLLECLLSLDEINLDQEILKKKRIICQKCSSLALEINQHTVPLNILPDNNLTSTLSTFNDKEFCQTLFLMKFLQLHKNPGVFCGPAMVDTLAKIYGITIFLYTSPPLKDSFLMNSGNDKSNKNISLFMTIDNHFAVGGVDWEKNIIVFNPEAKSENPLCLGLLVNHFIVLNMKAKKSL